MTGEASVPIYYESRVSKLSLNAAGLPKIGAVMAGEVVVGGCYVGASDSIVLVTYDKAGEGPLLMASNPES
jgi:hypothetical protein